MEAPERNRPGTEVRRYGTGEAAWQRGPGGLGPGGLECRLPGVDGPCALVYPREVLLPTRCMLVPSCPSTLPSPSKHQTWLVSIPPCSCQACILSPNAADCLRPSWHWPARQVSSISTEQQFMRPAMRTGYSVRDGPHGSQFVEHLASPLQSDHHLLAIFAPSHGVISLLQHLAKLILAIDLSDELVLDVRPYGVDHEVHDRLGHSVLQILTDDLEVGDEKRSDDVRLELGARGLLRGLIRCRWHWRHRRWRRRRRRRLLLLVAYAWCLGFGAGAEEGLQEIR
mmetsp:Transcript_19928/g.44488  ORF Transcript_19928/g.44488 Transcript_19928/m.44488 type:complete len:283 (+) Transcript_19928:253-1101(+)